MLIVNTEQHTATALMVEPFGTDGALRFVPMESDTPGRAFILDATSVRYLNTFLTNLAERTATEERLADFPAPESPDPDWMNP